MRFTRKVSRASFLGAVMDYMVEIDGVTLRTEIPTNKALRNNLMFNEGENCFISFMICFGLILLKKSRGVYYGYNYSK